MKKALSILLAVVLTLSLSSVAVFAAAKSKDKKPTMTSISGKRSIRKGDTASFSVTVKEGEGDYEGISESDVYWESSDDDVVWIDDSGDAEAMDYGVCTIRAFIYARDEDGKVLSSKVVTRSIEVRVPGGPKDAYPDDENDEEEEIVTPKPTTTTTTKNTSSSDSGSGQISSSTVTSAVKNAGSSATFKGYSSVSKTTITSANTTAKNAGKKVVLNFDTYKDGKFDGRLTINPANAANMASSVNTGVSIHSDNVGKYRTLFEKFFKNKNMAFIRLSQTNAFGMTVEVVAKVNLSGFGTTKYLYSYNPSTGKYAQVKNATFSKDGNGFWHIATNAGGVLIVTDSPLSK